MAYVHVPSQRRLKLDDRSEKHVFVGYGKQSKGYKLYNPVTRKVVVSRDVEFDEEGSWDWSIQECERYDFLPMTNEEETDETSEEARQSQSPTPTQDSPSSSIFENTMKRKKCRQAIDGEIRPIERKDTWKLTTLPKGQKAIGVKWSTRNGEKCEDDNEKCEDDHQKCDDDHEKLFWELYENHKSPSELLSDETLESDDLVSEDGDCGIEEKKFEIWVVVCHFGVVACDFGTVEMVRVVVCDFGAVVARVEMVRVLCLKIW
nr:retrovirus-related Pol polyprotein from transposon TNT 1-94 [Tanacetum cinerariifolium]